MSANASRSKRLDRLLKVQTQKRELEEWRLSHLRRERAEIDRKDVEIIDSLNAETSLHGLFLDAKVRNLRRNESTRKQNAAQQEVATGRIQDARRIERGVEKARNEANRSERSEAANTELNDAIEPYAAKPPASFE